MWPLVRTRLRMKTCRYIEFLSGTRRVRQNINHILTVNRAAERLCSKLFVNNAV